MVEFVPGSLWSEAVHIETRDANRRRFRDCLAEVAGLSVDAVSCKRGLSRAHRGVVLEEFASGAWRPAQDDPGPALVTAERTLIAAADAIQEPNRSRRGG